MTDAPAPSRLPLVDGREQGVVGGHHGYWRGRVCGVLIDGEVVGYVSDEQVRATRGGGAARERRRALLCVGVVDRIGENERVGGRVYACAVCVSMQDIARVWCSDSSSFKPRRIRDCEGSAVVPLRPRRSMSTRRRTGRRNETRVARSDQCVACFFLCFCLLCACRLLQSSPSWVCLRSFGRSINSLFRASPLSAHVPRPPLPSIHSDPVTRRSPLFFGFYLSRDANTQTRNPVLADSTRMLVQPCRWGQLSSCSRMHRAALG